jgi:hypothetical protein
MSKNNESLPIDINGNKFFSATVMKAPIVTNISVALGFVAITLDASCKAIHVSTRDETNFQISDLEAGTTYATMKSGIYMDIAGDSGKILFYVKGTATTVLEVVPFD